MALQIIATDVSGNPAVNLGATDSAIVRTNVTVTSDLGVGIKSTASSGQGVSLLGDIFAVSGIELGNSNAANGLMLNIAASGMIQAITGVTFTGSHKMTNSGIIEALDHAINITGSNAVSVITNKGSLFGGSIAIEDNGAGVRLVNTGHIEGADYAFLGSNTGVDSFVNRGTVIGTIDMAGGDDVVDLRNSTVTGNVLLGAGNDTLDLRNANVIGTIDGGVGNDRFILGSASETVNGGSGFDTIDFVDAASTVTVSLTSRGQNQGVALGDTYTSIENVSGGGFFDVITGSSLANTIEGRGGSDTIYGMAGDDILIGGAGGDSLHGGGGNDKFVLTEDDNFVDSIYFFNEPISTSNDDVIQISRAAFGLTLSLGVLNAANFVVRATDNAAQDADDYFIFRDNSNELYFDPDGNGLTFGAFEIVQFVGMSSYTLSNIDIEIVA